MAALKTVHVACAMLWIGNFVVTGFWSVRAWLTRDAAIRAFAAREILATDVAFTLVFGAAVTISGVALAGVEHVPVGATLWTRTALDVVVGAGVVWLAVLLPLELRMRRLAGAGTEAAFGRAFALWNAVGWLVTLALVAVIYLMVEKPT